MAAKGQTLIITKRGQPIAKLEPITRLRKPIWGSWKGIVKIKGDIVNFHDDWGPDS